MEGGYALTALYRQQSAHDKVLRVAQRLLNIDPLQEAAHTLLMESYWQTGQRGRALAQYELLSNALSREMGVDPAPETQRLSRRIQRNEPLEAAPGSPQRSSLPLEPTPFIGRAVELAEVGALLSEDHCRLLTLLGIGGSGKTRLAVALARAAADRFPDGVAFVGFDAVADPALIPATIAAALTTSGQSIVTAAQLNNYLAGRRMLLVLDNLEHLTEGAAEVLPALLKAAPSVKLVVTTRERLRLQEEWVYDVGGLGETDAPQLVLSAARQAGARVSSSQDPDSIAALCRWVDGLPLALEIAGALLRDLSPAALLDQMTADLDTVRSPLRNIPERQRSLRALFEFAWVRLSPADRDALSRLSVFVGGFNLTAAQAVAGAGQAALDRLQARALIQRTDSDRFALHPVIRQYAAAALDADPGAATANQQAHADHFTRLLLDQEADLFTLNFRAACDMLTADADNLAAAWRWHAQNHDGGTLIAMGRPLVQWALLTGRFVAVLGLLDAALDYLPDTPQYNLTRAWVLVYGLQVKHVLRMDEQRPDRIAHAYTAFTAAGDQRGHAALLRLHGLQSGNNSGLYEDGLALIEQSLALSRELGDDEGCVKSLIAVSNMNMNRGIWSVAGEALDAALATGLQDPVIVPDLYWARGMIDFFRERFADSLVHYEKALEFDRTHGLDAHYATVLIIYGSALMCIERYDEAEQAFRQAITFYQNIGHNAYVASCHERLGEMLFRQDSYAECYTYYQRAIELYRRKGIIVGVTDALGNFGNMSATKQVMLSEGRAALEEAIALVKEHGLERKLARYYRALAHVLVLLGDLAPVPTTLTEAVQTALRLDNTGELMEVFYVLALYAQTTHMTGLARVAAARVADDPATSELTRGYAANLLTALPLDDPHAVPDDPALSALVSGQPVGT
jgi:predicted ATPase